MLHCPHSFSFLLQDNCFVLSVSLKLSLVAKPRPPSPSCSESNIGQQNNLPWTQPKQATDPPGCNYFRHFLAPGHKYFCSPPLSPQVLVPDCIFVPSRKMALFNCQHIPFMLKCPKMLEHCSFLFDTVIIDYIPHFVPTIN